MEFLNRVHGYSVRKKIEKSSLKIWSVQKKFVPLHYQKKEETPHKQNNNTLNQQVMANMRKWAEEKPEPFKRIVVVDIHGNNEGHLSTPLVYDGKIVCTNLAHTIRVDRDNIVEWCYLEDLYK